MAITITATPFSATANSYVTLEEADAYLEAHLKAADWAAFTDEQKKAALVSACRFIENMQFTGRRQTQAQSLSWPRFYIYDFDAYVVTGIPSKLKAAQCELAIYNLTEDDRLAGRFELESMKSVEIGPVKYQVKDDAEYIPDFIEDLLEAIGPNVLADGNISTMTL